MLLTLDSILIPVANASTSNVYASTGNVYMTTACIQYYVASGITHLYV